MPSVGTRRSTRIFAPTKPVKPPRPPDAEAARVLRSGKRLADDGVWMKMFGGGGGVEAADCRPVKGGGALKNQAKADDGALSGDRSDGCAVTTRGRPSAPSLARVGGRDKMFGLVYGRRTKRKRKEKDVMYGVQFRRTRRRHCTRFALSQRALVSVFVRRSWLSLSHFANFLVSVLRWMVANSGFSASGFVAFLLSESIFEAFARNGIVFVATSFMLDHSASGHFEEARSCNIFGVHQFIPLISFSFSALPMYFTRLYLEMRLRSARFAYRLQHIPPETIEIDDEYDPCIYVDMNTDSIGSSMHGSPSAKRSVGAVISSTMGNTGLSERLSLSVGSSRHKRRKSSVTYPGVQKYKLTSRKSVASVTDFDRLAKLSSLSKVPIDPPHDRVNEASNSCGKINDYSSSIQRRSPRLNSIDNVKEINSSMIEPSKQLDTVRCNANILVLESDRCWREQGAKVMLEESDSGESCLAVKRDGATRYLYKALESRLFATNTANRVTHAIIWTGQSSWKLEFCEQEDWIIFKELHRACCERNSNVTPERSIPVPVVREVIGYEDEEFIPFVRPEGYITGMNDEVQRALSGETTFYDMDSEDGRLLHRLNTESAAKEKESISTMTKDNFEKVVYLFERAAYAHPDDVSDENKAANLCIHLGRSEVVSSIYRYWLVKRKQKSSPLVQYFQAPPPRKAQFENKKVYRKKRSFKRQASQGGRTKRETLPQEIGREFGDRFTAAGSKEDWQRVQEAQAAATTAIRCALLKRTRAQKLALNADLLLHKSVMASRLAEGVCAAETLDGGALLQIIFCDSLLVLQGGDPVDFFELHRPELN